MVLDPELRDPACQLFVEEVRELLQSIGQRLPACQSEQTLAPLCPLLPVLPLFQESATHLQLQHLDRHILRLNKVLQTLSQQKMVTATHITLLQKIVNAVQRSLFTPVPVTGDVEADQVLSQLEDEITPPPLSIAARPDQQPLSDVEAEQLLITEITRALKQFETCLTVPPTEQSLTEIKHQLETLRDLGEMLDISELVALTQTTLTGLQASPQVTQTLCQIALTGLRPIHESIMTQTSTVVPIARDRRPETVITPQGSSGEQFSAARVQGATTTQLKTVAFFIWQSDRILFVLPAQQVVEITMPRAVPMLEAQYPWPMDWQGQRLSVYSLAHLWQGANMQPLLTIPSPAASQLLPILILRQDNTTLALQVNIDRLVTLPILTLLPLEVDAFSYCYGSTRLDGSPLLTVINLQAFLEDMRVIQPFQP